MPKFKPAKGKATRPAAPKAGLPCVILILLGFVLILAFVFLVMFSQGK